LDGYLNSDFEILAPAPSATIESLTGVGYSLKTAIADLVDNSITAMSKNIWLDLHWDGPNSYISILDDGLGMGGEEISEAMRPGGKNPLHERDVSDLGRFSLGLKTASWSQCRRVSVWSKMINGVIDSRCWDLDYVAKHNEWRVLKSLGREPELSRLESLTSGTLVKWTNLSSPLFEELVNSKDGLIHFNEHISEMQAYLGMIFHRFILGIARSNKNSGPVNIYVNGDKTVAWNPFEVSENIFSQVTPLETVEYMGVPLDIKGYILPHKDKLSEQEYKSGAGPNGWIEQQGFYVFRAERLLVAGDWLGLGRGRPWVKEEQYRLARISIEIPNSLDQAWSLDIKKSTAMPPPQLKAKLTMLAEKVREDAKKSFIYRGKYGPRPTAPTHISIPAWEQASRNGVLTYRINKKHPLYLGLREKLGGLTSDFDSTIRMIEESVPIQKIWIDAAESDQNHAIPYEGLDDELKSDIKKMYKFLVTKMDSKRAVELIKASDPFNRYPDLVDEIVDKL
jgi:hypothetical protein